MDLSIIIVSWNTRDLTDRCLRSVYDTVTRPFEVFLVDNASRDGSADMVAAKYPEARLIRNRRNLGFAKANNQAVPLCRGRYVLFLNSDAKLLPGSADGLAAFLDASPAHGAAAPMLLNEDGTLQRSCRRIPPYGGLLAVHTSLRWKSPGQWPIRRLHMLGWSHDDDRDVEQPMAACLLVRRSVLETVGTFDEGCFLLYNDVDLCKRILRAGHRIAYRAGLKVVHFEGASITKYVRLKEEGLRNVTHYIRKHYGPAMSFFFVLAVIGDAAWRGDWAETIRLLRASVRV